MTRRQLIILLVLVLAVGGGGLFVFKKSAGSWKETGGEMGGKVLGDFPLNDVTELDLRDKQEGVHIAKKKDRWVVAERADYPASFTQLSELIQKLWELKAVQSLTVGPSQRPRLGLVEPGKGPDSGTLVELKGSDGKIIRSLLVGKTYTRQSDQSFPMGGGMPAGRYVMPVGGEEPVSLVTDSLLDVNPNPVIWLNKEFVKVEKPKAVLVTGSNNVLLWEASRADEKSDWKLAGAKPGEAIEPAKGGSLSTLLSSPGFIDVASPDLKPSATGLDHPITATIQTFDGLAYTVRIGKTPADEYYLTIAASGEIPKQRIPGANEKPEEKAGLDQQFAARNKVLEENVAKAKTFEGRVFKVARNVIETFLLDRAQLLAAKTPAPSPAATPVVSGARAPAPLPPPKTPGSAPGKKGQAVYTAPVTWPPRAVQTPSRTGTATGH